MVLLRRTVIGYLTKHGLLFQPKRSKTKQIATCKRMLSRFVQAWYMELLPILAGSCRYLLLLWLVIAVTLVLVLQNSLDQSLIQISWLLLVVHVMEHMQCFFSAEAQNTHFSYKGKRIAATLSKCKRLHFAKRKDIISVYWQVQWK